MNRALSRFSPICLTHLPPRPFPAIGLIINNIFLPDATSIVILVIPSIVIPSLHRHSGPDPESAHIQPFTEIPSLKMRKDFSQLAEYQPFPKAALHIPTLRGRESLAFCAIIPDPVRNLFIRGIAGQARNDTRSGPAMTGPTSSFRT